MKPQSLPNFVKIQLSILKLELRDGEQVSADEGYFKNFHMAISSGLDSASEMGYPQQEHIKLGWMRRGAFSLEGVRDAGDSMV